MKGMLHLYLVLSREVCTQTTVHTIYSQSYLHYPPPLLVLRSHSLLHSIRSLPRQTYHLSQSPSYLYTPPPHAATTLKSTKGVSAPPARTHLEATLHNSRHDSKSLSSSFQTAALVLLRGLLYSTPLPLQRTHKMMLFTVFYRSYLAMFTQQAG